MFNRVVIQPTCGTDPRFEIKRILLIEDNNDDAQLVTENLKDILGWEVVMDVAPTLYDALERLQSSENYDVILLDLILPDSDGFKLFQRIKDAVESKTAPIIVVTGTKDMDLVEQVLHHGAAHVIPKDELEPKTLRKRIETAIAWKRSMSRSESTVRAIRKIGESVHSLVLAL